VPQAVVREVEAKGILTKTGIPGASWCVNPYTGCAHACRYCYATFMNRYSGHTEPWGTWVDVKKNAPEILDRQLARAAKGRVILSSVTDCYQGLEARHRITRRCLEALLRHGFPVNLLTKSPLVLRDLDLLREFPDIKVGLTVTTDDDQIRKAFEPGAPPITERLRALAALKDAGIPAYAFVGPLLPCDPEALGRLLAPLVTEVLVDRMNYASKTTGLYRKLGLSRWLEPEVSAEAVDRLKEALGGTCKEA
jgi:DNA repair photolyase